MQKHVEVLVNSQLNTSQTVCPHGHEAIGILVCIKSSATSRSRRWLCLVLELVRLHLRLWASHHKDTELHKHFQGRARVVDGTRKQSLKGVAGGTGLFTVNKKVALSLSTSL